MKPFRIHLSLLLVTMLLVSSMPALSANAAYPAAPPGDGPGQCTDPEAVLDQSISRQMKDSSLPGLAVSLVSRDRVLLTKGYGYADLEADRPVDPRQTLFPVGSVAKPVTWLAVMQLVEQALVDLDRPANEYLPAGVQIPEQFDQPITVENLMTHSAGFEDRIIGIFARDPMDLPSPESYFAEFGFPKQVEPPGRFTVYCNDCVVLAALIVEQVSGQSFEAYIEKNIFDPLGMQHSTFRQLLPDGFGGELARVTV